MFPKSLCSSINGFDEDGVRGWLGSFKWKFKNFLNNGFGDDELFVPGFCFYPSDNSDISHLYTSLMDTVVYIEAQAILMPVENVFTITGRGRNSFGEVKEAGW